MPVTVTVKYQYAPVAGVLTLTRAPLGRLTTEVTTRSSAQVLLKAAARCRAIVRAAAIRFALVLSF